MAAVNITSNLDQTFKRLSAVNVVFASSLESLEIICNKKCMNYKNREFSILGSLICVIEVKALSLESLTSGPGQSKPECIYTFLKQYKNISMHNNTLRYLRTYIQV